MCKYTISAAIVVIFGLMPASEPHYYLDMSTEGGADLALTVNGFPFVLVGGAKATLQPSRSLCVGPYLQQGDNLITWALDRHEAISAGFSAKACISNRTPGVAPLFSVAFGSSQMSRLQIDQGTAPSLIIRKGAVGESVSFQQDHAHFVLDCSFPLPMPSGRLCRVTFLGNADSLGGTRVTTILQDQNGNDLAQAEALMSDTTPLSVLQCNLDIPAGSRGIELRLASNPGAGVHAVRLEIEGESPEEQGQRTINIDTDFQPQWTGAEAGVSISDADRASLTNLVVSVRQALLAQDYAALSRLFRRKNQDHALFFKVALDRVEQQAQSQMSAVLANVIDQGAVPSSLTFSPINTKVFRVSGPDGTLPVQFRVRGDDGETFIFKLPLMVGRFNGNWEIVM